MRQLFFVLAFIGSWYCYAEGGFYAGIGAGYTSITNIPQSGFTFNDGSSASQNGGSFTTAVYGGYNFNRIIGVQLDYNVAYNAQGSGSYNVNQQLVDAALMLHMPFGLFADALRGFSLFAKGGIGYSAYGFGNVSPSCATCVNPPSNAYAVIPVYGVGAEYGFSKIGIRAEWDYSGNVTAPNLGNNQVQLNSNMYLLSILYHF